MYDIEKKLDFLMHARLPKPIDEDDKGWLVDDSTFADYCSWVLPTSEHPTGIGGIILESLKAKKDPVALDLAAGTNGRALLDLLAAGLIKKGFMTSYADNRTKEVKDLDELEHIPGNLIDPDSWLKIIRLQKVNCPDGFDLIMHRPAGTLQDFRPDVYSGAAHLLLDMLSPKSVMYTQIPEALRRPNYLSQTETICQSLAERSDIGDVMKFSSTIETDLPGLAHAVFLKK